MRHFLNWPDWLANLRCMVARARYVRTVKLGERGYPLDIDPTKVAAAPKEFTDEQKVYLRPIAETLAMLDGNAFFDLDETHWQHGYLAEAWALFESNGGLEGWAGGASFARPYRTKNEAQTALLGCGA